MQYFFLVAIFLMLAEGIQVYIFVVHIFHVRTFKESAAFIIGAWGMRRLHLTTIYVTTSDMRF